MNIIILGPQGSGKSTQAQLLSQELNLPLLDVGSLLRLKAQEETEAGRKIKGLVERGELVDDLTTTALLREELSGKKYEEGFVMDGAPRTVNQARLLEGIVKPDKVFYLAVPDEVNTERLIKRGRQDDTPKIIETRLKLYHENTQPALDYYKEKVILEKVDGTKTQDEVFQEILRRIKND
ncbi:MAG: nucleoside monophosphate kinase [Candidatus Blackburnbacteria bacterium]|nr:nucleoside monophosphate kinase [Candidatus Blackburnbacteria bacterium]